MKRSRLLATLCVASLVVFAAGCSDDDDLPTGTLNPAVVAAGLSEAIPAAIELPIVLIDIITAVVPVPATRGIQTCSGPVPGVCDVGMGTLTCAPNSSNPANFDLTFAGCSIDGAVVDGMALLAPNPPSASVTFQTGFTVDGDSLTGQVQITQTGPTTYSVIFNGLSLAVDVGRTDVDGGPMTIDTGANNVNAAGLLVFLDGSPALPPFDSVVNILNNAITALATDMSTDPPTQYDCTGTLGYNGEVTTDLVCL